MAKGSRCPLGVRESPFFVLCCSGCHFLLKEVLCPSPVLPGEVSSSSSTSSVPRQSSLAKCPLRPTAPKEVLCPFPVLPSEVSSSSYSSQGSPLPRQSSLVKCPLRFLHPLPAPVLPSPPETFASSLPGHSTVAVHVLGKSGPLALNQSLSVVLCKHVDTRGSD